MGTLLEEERKGEQKDEELPRQLVLPPAATIPNLAGYTREEIINLLRLTVAELITAHGAKDIKITKDGKISFTVTQQIEVDAL